MRNRAIVHITAPLYTLHHTLSKIQKPTLLSLQDTPPPPPYTGVNQPAGVVLEKLLKGNPCQDEVRYIVNTESG